MTETHKGSGDGGSSARCHRLNPLQQQQQQCRRLTIHRKQTTVVMRRCLAQEVEKYLNDLRAHKRARWLQNRSHNSCRGGAKNFLQVVSVSRRLVACRLFIENHPRWTFR